MPLQEPGITHSVPAKDNNKRLFCHRYNAERINNCIQALLSMLLLGEIENMKLDLSLTNKLVVLSSKALATIEANLMFGHQH